MKKLILILTFLLLPGLCFAGSIQDMHRSVIARKNAGGAACSTPATGNWVNEGFVGAGYENGVCGAATCVTETQGTPDEDHTLTTGDGIPTDSCTEGVLFDANTAESSIEITFAEIEDNTYNVTIVIEVLFTTLTLDAGTAASIFNYNEAGSAYVYVTVKELSGSYYINAVGDTTSTNIAVSTGTWYTITIVGNTDNTASIDINSTNETFTRTDFEDPTFFKIGPFSGIGAGERITMEVGRVYINAVTP